ncbi:MAG: nuclear transport factor 2 family protein [Acidimicrobiales bacterium]
MGAAANRRLVQAAFDKGLDAVFDLLRDDARWTITGTSPFAGIYTSRRQLLDEVIARLNAWLARPIQPTVESIVAEGDRVVVLWRGHAVALDGEPYDNVYSWHMRLEGGSVVEVTAFFDAPTLRDLLDRVQAP